MNSHILATTIACVLIAVVVCNTTTWIVDKLIPDVYHPLVYNVLVLLIFASLTYFKSDIFELMVQYAQQN